MYKGLTRSSGSAHLLLIPCRHQSLKMLTHIQFMHARKTCTGWPLLCRQSIGVACWVLSERNDYHTSVSTCHWALPVSALSLSHAQTLTFTDSSIGRFMLIQIVGGCVCMWQFLSVHLPFVWAQYVDSWSVSFSLINHSPYFVCQRTNSMAWTVFFFSFRREWWHLPEAGAVHLQHCLRDLSSWSGMYGSLPPQQVSDASQHHISRVCPRLCRKSTLLSWHGARWNSKCESARGCFSRASNPNCVGCIWDTYSCKIYSESGFSEQVCHKMLLTKRNTQIGQELDHVQKAIRH